MFSNLASYIFGASDENPEQGPQQQPPAQVASPPKGHPAGEDEWVVVGGEVQPTLTLGSLDEVAPRPSTGSTGSSVTPSESGGDEEEMVIVEPNPEALPIEASASNGTREITLTRSARRLASPLSCPNGVSLPQMKALRSSQKIRQKDSGKHLTPKATERQNKAVKIRSNHQSGSKKNKAANLTFKASGFNKQLKQC